MNSNEQTITRRSPRRMLAERNNLNNHNSSSKGVLNDETPTRFMVELVLESRVKKQKSLISSKSLAQVVKRNIFFGKKSEVEAHEQQRQQQQKHKMSKLNKIQSFPTTNHDNPITSQSMLTAYSMSEDNLANDDEMINVNSNKIEGTNNRTSTKLDNLEDRKAQVLNRAEDNVKKTTEGIGLDKILGLTKRTNLLGNKLIRQRSKGQPFQRLTNELATPPTKLYSPFGIESPNDNRADKTSPSLPIKDSNSKRKLNLNKLGKSRQPKVLNGFVSILANPTDDKKVGSRQNFTFYSPTGKFQETVKDVELSQQCIENISKAIMTRSSSQS